MVTFQDEVMQKLSERVLSEHPNPPLPLTPAHPDEYFSHLVESIASQQLSVKASDTIIARAKAAIGGNWQSEIVLSTPFETLRATGLSNAKTQYIINLAEFWAKQDILPTQYESLSDAEIISHLTQVKGIGQWTVEMFLIFCMARHDVFSVGDLGLRNAVSKAYSFDPALTPKELAALAQTWSPNRSWASRVLWKSLDL